MSTSSTIPHAPDPHPDRHVDTRFCDAHGASSSKAVAFDAGVYPRSLASHPPSFRSASSTALEFIEWYRAASTPVRGTMDAVAARRLRKLETFEGDPDLGFEKPLPSAVHAVRHLLASLYEWRPELEAPAISPAADGEILMSWRRAKAYMVLSFIEGDRFEWSFKVKKRLYGAANVSSGAVARDLAAVLDYLLEGVAGRRLSHGAPLPLMKEGGSSAPPAPIPSGTIVAE